LYENGVLTADSRPLYTPSKRDVGAWKVVAGCGCIVGLNLFARFTDVSAGEVRIIDLAAVAAGDNGVTGFVILLAAVLSIVGDGITLDFAGGLKFAK
jgi:hypothetical protein